MIKIIEKFNLKTQEYECYHKRGNLFNTSWIILKGYGPTKEAARLDYYLRGCFDGITAEKLK